MAYNPHLSLSIQQQRQRLPVYKHKNHILYLVEKYQTVVIVGETGCGKSTQIPQYLYENGWAGGGKLIGVTQPRRVATTTVAGRVAEEMGSMLGQEVGYTIRFDDVSDPRLTKVKFMTDGLLVREMMADPLLNKYSVIMLDEAHERSLYTDIITGLLKKILKKRKDLRLIVSSATLDAEMFRDFFNLNTTSDRSQDTASILTVEGRMFPVNVYYTYCPTPDYVKAIVTTIWAIHQEESPGDVLAFVTGQDEVQRVVSRIRDLSKHLPSKSSKLLPLPMYGGLPATEQVVVATNIAEASITINGIVYVIDCGFVKIRAYNPENGLEALVVTPVAKSSAEQRAGRAGRVRSVLQLKSLGIDNVLRFNFLSPPPAKSMIRALDLLYALGALDDAGNLTNPLGLQMSEFPLHPMFAKMLLVSGDFGCSEEILTIAAMLQIDNVFLTPFDKKKAADRAKVKFSVHEGDHMTLLNVYNAFLQHQKTLLRAVDIREQLKRTLKRFKVRMCATDEDAEPIQRCIVAGFFANAARLHASGTYRVVFHEVVQTSKDFMRDITVIEPEWLYELAPHYYEYGTVNELAAKRAKLF
ncbi:probable ATP-dependent RNA helicase DHX35 [Oscarella lobularis]|uniref:probable ATP-dependent RNA helicase DHX35 n=1 Tax=Oscarella lobularis TaxID=121494 RepID=UPI0033141C0B